MYFWSCMLSRAILQEPIGLQQLEQGKEGIVSLLPLQPPIPIPPHGEDAQGSFYLHAFDGISRSLQLDADSLRSGRVLQKQPSSTKPGF